MEAQVVKAIEIVTVSNSKLIIFSLGFLISKKNNLIDSSVRVAGQISIEDSVTSQLMAKRKVSYNYCHCCCR